MWNEFNVIEFNASNFQREFYKMYFKTNTFKYYFQHELNIFLGLQLYVLFFKIIISLPIVINLWQTTAGHRPLPICCQRPFADRHSIWWERVLH